ncbi:DUF6221 family protein [Streptomyces europaeiscabiei]|uniref:DUF6221 family protein n=1 Tax=Streptomyces europaeiscabiei TaxID=146819 RepID=UPI0029BD2368|nr:DUF6221 family protein [Streptomyces europaeiscabiei]MDX2757881.1 DUF6221 family protein [Streptomyces europaeiscabiei]
MSEIADFLRTRYTEACDRQQCIIRNTWEPGAPCPVCERPTEGMHTYGGSLGPIASFEPCRHEIHDPAAMWQFEKPAPDPDILADLEVKLALVDLMAGMLSAAEGDSEVDHYGGLSVAEEALALLAQPFAGHPDHKGEEWAP